MSRPVAVTAAVVVLIVLVLVAWRVIPSLGPQTAAESEAAALEVQVSLNTASMQEQLEDSVAGQLYDAARERMDSPLGQALSRRCSDWTDFFENHPGEEVRQNRDRACAELREYVNSGTVPAEFDREQETSAP